jgi:hypothetical protein
MEGTYTTDALAIGNTTSASFKLMGAGKTKTTLRLKNDATYSPSAGFNYVMLSQFLQDFYLADLTIDCNWYGQGGVGLTCSGSGSPPLSKISSAYTCGYKNGGVYVYCKTGKIERVKVINFGANGQVPWTGAGVEAFPLVLRTPNIGQSESAPALVIQDCEVTGFTSVNGGYCTAIFVNTRLTLPPYFAQTIDCSTAFPPPTAPDADHYQRQLGCRANVMALVQNNTVYNLAGGIAYGAADSERVTFMNNSALDCTLGFNCDTFYATNIVIDGNSFIDVEQGIHIGAGGYGASSLLYGPIVINNNLFRLRGGRQYKVYHNVYYDYCATNYPNANYLQYVWDDSYAIRLSGATTDVVVSNNQVTAIPAALFASPSGQQPRYYFIRALSGGDVDFPGIARWCQHYNAFQLSGNTVSSSPWSFSTIPSPGPNETWQVPQ